MYVGVTVMVAILGIEVVLIAVKAGKLPVPESPNPMELLELLQAKSVVPPVIAVEKTWDEIGVPLQTTIF